MMTTLKCPKCGSVLELNVHHRVAERRTDATQIPAHRMPPRLGHLDNVAMEIDGEMVVVVLQPLCPLSGAEFKKIP